MAKLMDMLFGRKPEMKAMPTMAPDQQQLFSQLLQALGGQGGQGGQGGIMQSAFGNLQKQLSGDTSALEAPAMRNFFENIVPGISETFSGMGAQGSSAFQQALGSAGAGLAENLSMQKSNMQQQGLGNAMQLFQMGTQTPTFQWQQMPGTPGFMNQLMQMLGQGGGMAAGFGGMGYLGKKLGLFN